MTIIFLFLVRLSMTALAAASSNSPSSRSSPRPPSLTLNKSSAHKNPHAVLSHSGSPSSALARRSSPHPYAVVHSAGSVARSSAPSSAATNSGPEQPAREGSAPSREGASCWSFLQKFPSREDRLSCFNALTDYLCVRGPPCIVVREITGLWGIRTPERCDCFARGSADEEEDAVPVHLQLLRSRSRAASSASESPKSILKTPTPPSPAPWRNRSAFSDESTSAGTLSDEEASTPLPFACGGAPSSHQFMYGCAASHSDDEGEGGGRARTPTVRFAPEEPARIVPVSYECLCRRTQTTLSSRKKLRRNWQAGVQKKNLTKLWQHVCCHDKGRLLRDEELPEHLDLESFPTLERPLNRDPAEIR